MIVEIWSDVVCPWCYIGKRRFETAIADRDDIEVVWRSFELAPRAPQVRDGDMAGHIARKYGLPIEVAERSVANITEQAAAEGLDYRLDVARGGNTFDAHRLLHLARERGIQDAVKERFLRAYFTEGVAIGLPENLLRLATEAGLDAAEVQAVLDGNAYAAEVREDEDRALEHGITAVPSFVVDGRMMIPGAEDPETIRRVLERATASR